MPLIVLHIQVAFGITRSDQIDLYNVGITLDIKNTLDVYMYSGVYIGYVRP